MDNILVTHTSPKVLIAVDVTVNGAIVTTGYKVCVKPVGVTPDKTDALWQTPDSAPPDTGVFVGPDVNLQFSAGDVIMPWAWDADNPESIIFPCPPAWQFT